MPHPLQARNAELRAELQRLQADNAVLAHRVAREREKAKETEREKARMETELEVMGPVPLCNSSSFTPPVAPPRAD